MATVGGRLPSALVAATARNCGASGIMAAHLDQSSLSPVVLAALEYGGLGFRVIPLDRNKKRPIIHGWPRHATKDYRVIPPLFEKWPDCNIGIATGRGLFALDIDPRHGGDRSLARLTRGRTLPPTARSRTGGGGFHYLFRTPPDVRVRNDQGTWPGIDIRGDGGLIVVEPSIHKSGRQYVWLRLPSQGIAEPPGWLVEKLASRGLWLPGGTADEDWLGVSLSLDYARENGDPDALLAEMIGRYPVRAYGQRNDLMVKVIASLLGRRLCPEIVQAVTEAWWGHFHRLGVVRTSPTKAPGMIRTSIRSMLQSRQFVIADSKADHLAACRAIELGPEQRLLFRASLGDLAGLESLLPRQAREDQDRKAVTPMRDRLCISDQEERYVEALAVHVIHERSSSRDGVIRMTDAQVRDLIADRHGQALHSQQIARLKPKYISRLGKPAQLFELLREARKGSYGGRGRSGTPSEYEATGIVLFLTQGDVGAPKPECSSPTAA